MSRSIRRRKIFELNKNASPLIGTGLFWLSGLKGHDEDGNIISTFSLENYYDLIYNDTEAFLDLVQSMFDYLSFIPVFGTVFDVGNLLISLSRENYVDACFNLLSIIPISDYVIKPIHIILKPFLKSGSKLTTEAAKEIFDLLNKHGLSKKFIEQIDYIILTLKDLAKKFRKKIIKCSSTMCEKVIDGEEFIEIVEDGNTFLIKKEIYDKSGNTIYSGIQRLLGVFESLKKELNYLLKENDKYIEDFAEKLGKKHLKEKFKEQDSLSEEEFKELAKMVEENAIYKFNELLADLQVGGYQKIWDTFFKPNLEIIYEKYRKYNEDTIQDVINNLYDVTKKIKMEKIYGDNNYGRMVFTGLDSIPKIIVNIGSIAFEVYEKFGKKPELKDFASEIITLLTHEFHHFIRTGIMFQILKSNNKINIGKSNKLNEKNIKFIESIKNDLFGFATEEAKAVFNRDSNKMEELGIKRNKNKDSHYYFEGCGKDIYQDALDPFGRPDEMYARLVEIKHMSANKKILKKLLYDLNIEIGIETDLIENYIESNNYNTLPNSYKRILLFEIFLNKEYLKSVIPYKPYNYLSCIWNVSDPKIAEEFANFLVDKILY